MHQLQECFKHISMKGRGEDGTVEHAAQEIGARRGDGRAVPELSNGRRFEIRPGVRHESGAKESQTFQRMGGSDEAGRSDNQAV